MRRIHAVAGFEQNVWWSPGPTSGQIRRMPQAKSKAQHGLEFIGGQFGPRRHGGARYAVPQELVGLLVEVLADDGAVIISRQGTEVVRHLSVAPGEVAMGSLALELRRPARAVRPRTASEIAFLGLGQSAEAFLRAAAAGRLVGRVAR